MHALFDATDLVLYILVVSRIAGIVVSGPIFSERSVPIQAKIGIACLVGFIAYSPLAVSGVANTLSFDSPIGFSILVVKESLIGVAIGFVARLLFYGLQLVAYLVDFQMGFGMAGVFDPSLGTHASPLGSLVNWIALMVFLSINGHHLIIDVLVKSYDLLPLGWSTTGHDLLFGVVSQLAYTTKVSIGLFGPVLVVMGAVELLMAILSKAAPQMNILTVSMPAKIGLGVIALSLWVITLDGPLSNAMARHLAWLPSLLRLLASK